MEEPSILELPEGCYTHIISLSTPQVACASAQVSSGFRSAADSDFVWENFLPGDYRNIISSSVTPFSETDLSSKKKIYFRMCKPVFFDESKKYLNLEKRSGKKCITIGARALSIVWSNTSQYWIWEPHTLSKFAEVAELIDVCWLEIVGYVRTQTLSPKTIYGAYLVIKHAHTTYRLNEFLGDAWVSFGSGGGITSARRKVCLKRSNYNPPELDGVQFPSARGDQWMELELGEFYNDQEDDGDVNMNLLMMGTWKRGLIVEGIEVRPKANPDLVLPAAA